MHIPYKGFLNLVYAETLLVSSFVVALVGGRLNIFSVMGEIGPFGNLISAQNRTEHNFIRHKLFN